MTPLAYLILDSAGRMVDSGGPTDHEKLAGSVARLNEHSEANAYRLVPVAEIPAWQAIETAPRDGSEIVLWEDGERYFARWSQESNPEGWESTDCGVPLPDATHWQPLPAPPKEAPDAKS